MKVLVTASTFPRWKNDSTPSFVLDLCKNLKKEGIDIIALAPHYPGAKFEEVLEGVKVYRFPYLWPYKYQKVCYDGGILPNLKRSHLAKFQLPLFFFFELYYTLKLILTEKVDCVNSHWVIPQGLVGALSGKLLGVKHLPTIHAADLFSLEKMPFKNNIASFIFKNSTAVVVVSSQLKERFSNLLSGQKAKSKIHVIPMGIDTEVFKPKKNVRQLKSKYGITSKFVALAIGRFVEKKGFEYAIRAMKLVTAKTKNISLILIGDGPLRKQLENLVSELDLKDYVKFVGWADKNTLVDYYSLADVVLVPSIVTDSGDTEGMPVVVLEALAMGKPIIASNVGGISDFIESGKNGFLVAQKNSNQIVDKLQILTNDKKLSILFFRNSIRMQKSWQDVTKKYVSLIKRGQK